MTAFMDAIGRGFSTWRDDVDSAAADLPLIGAAFARNWRILRYGGSQNTYVTADGKELDIASHDDLEAARSDIAQLGTRGPLVLRMNAALGIRRDASFPDAAKRHLDEAIELALPRLSPLPASDIIFAADHGAVFENDGRITLPVSIVRRDTLDSALAFANSLGLDVAAVDLAHEGIGPAPDIDLREGRSTPSAGRSAFKFSAILVALLVLATAGFALDRNLRLDPQYESARRPASLEARLEAAIEHAEAKANAGSVTAALADLSARLPDGAYITSLSYEAGTIRLTGLAWDAAAALRALDAADEFTGAAFDGATVRDEETGRERFELTVRHRNMTAEAQP